MTDEQQAEDAQEALRHIERLQHELLAVVDRFLLEQQAQGAVRSAPFRAAHALFETLGVLLRTLVAVDPERAPGWIAHTLAELAAYADPSTMSNTRH